MAFNWTDLLVDGVALTAAERTAMAYFESIGRQGPGSPPLGVPNYNASQTKSALRTLSNVLGRVDPAILGAKKVLAYYRAEALTAFEVANP